MLSSFKHHNFCRFIDSSCSCGNTGSACNTAYNYNLHISPFRRFSLLRVLYSYDFLPCRLFHPIHKGKSYPFLRIAFRKNEFDFPLVTFPKNAE